MSTDPQTNYYGGFWLRVGSYIIDSIILYGVSLAINLALGVSSTSKEVSMDQIFAGLFTMLAGFLYLSLFQGWYEGSFGKHIMGLTLLDKESLERLSVAQSVGRYFMNIISFLCFAIGVMAVGWNPKKQGWHDRVAGTVVVKKESLEQLKLELKTSQAA